MRKKIKEKVAKKIVDFILKNQETIIIEGPCLPRIGRQDNTGRTNKK